MTGTDSRLVVLACLAALPALAAGCITGKANPALTQRATHVDPDLAKPEYWLRQPPEAAVVYDDFGKLFRASRRAAHRFSFTVDRLDYREGLLTTLPLIDKQFFEFWRNDEVVDYDILKSSVATTRRTIRFDVRRRDDGAYECVPKVVVEQFAAIEHRITSVVQYNEIFGVTPAEQRREQELNPGVPIAYWYATGRDRPLERALAQSIRQDLKSKPSGLPQFVTGAAITP